MDRLSTVYEEVKKWTNRICCTIMDMLRTAFEEVEQMEAGGWKQTKLMLVEKQTQADDGWDADIIDSTSPPPCMYVGQALAHIVGTCFA